MRHADGDDADFGRADALRLRDRVLSLHHRLAVGDDDHQVAGFGTVAAILLEHPIDGERECLLGVRRLPRPVAQRLDHAHQIRFVGCAEKQKDQNQNY